MMLQPAPVPFRRLRPSSRLSLWLVLVPLLAIASGPPAAAGVIHLSDGDRLTGELVTLAEGTLRLKPAWSNEPIEVPWSAVTGLESEAPLTLVLEDGTRLVGPVEPSAERSETVVVLSEPVAAPATVRLAAITAINPPEPPEPAVRLQGNASAGLIVNQGNTESRSLYLEAEAIARTETDRYTLGAQATRTEDDGETTADSSRGWVDYDHFLSERWYLASSALFTRDEFQDLKLRSSLALSSGYQFLETPRTELSAELGASYVDESFFDAEDDAYPAARWSFDLSHRLGGERVELFHSHEGFFNLEESGDPLIRSKTGARFKLLGAFIATTQVQLDYDADPAPGREREDWRYLVNLGVEF